MDHDSYSRQCYDEMCKTDKLGTTNWVTKVKRMLFSYGYGCVWLTQFVGDETQFLNSFRLRIEDSFRQKWYTDISENKKLETYKTFKSLLEPEIYLDSFFLRRELSKFRISNHNLMIEEGRQKGIPRELRMCKSCDLGCVEDEYHFVIICPAYKNLRKKFIPNKFLKFTSILIFKNLMASRDPETNKGLALYIKVAMKLRKTFHI